MTTDEINKFMLERNDTKGAIVYTKDEVKMFLKMIEEKRPFYYGHTDLWLWQALDKYPINRNATAIIGSITAWYEANALYRGAFPYTIEYNQRASEDLRLRFMTPVESEEYGIVFDSALSISSFEHDGLGYYGEPIDPDADLKAMQKTKKLIKKDGLLFLAVPIGKDHIKNHTRVYGRTRFPLLIQGWELLDSFGMDFCKDKELWDTDGSCQPIFVLQNI